MASSLVWLFVLARRRFSRDVSGDANLRRCVVRELHEPLFAYRVQEPRLRLVRERASREVQAGDGVRQGADVPLAVGREEPNGGGRGGLERLRGLGGPRCAPREGPGRMRGFAQPSLLAFGRLVVAAEHPTHQCLRVPLPRHPPRGSSPRRRSCATRSENANNDWSADENSPDWPVANIGYRFDATLPGARLSGRRARDRRFTRTSTPPPRVRRGCSRPAA